MKTEEVTQQILDAWGEAADDQPEQKPEETEVEQPDEGAAVEQVEEETPAEEEETGDEEEETEETETEDKPDEEEKEEEPAEGDEHLPGVFESDDPEIKAFLAKFQGDPEKALRYGAQMQRTVSDLGGQRRALSQRVAELEGELSSARAFAGEGIMLSEQQRNWVSEAAESGNPLAYVREAVRANEFELARAVCVEWGRGETTFEALRVAQMVDQAEAQHTQTQTSTHQDEPVKPDLLLATLEEFFPDMPTYEEKMVETMAALGDAHPLVADARSNNPETAVRGVIGIYEIARASTNAVSQTREVVKNGRRDEATAARKKAVVSTSEASPSPSESPRAGKIGPGLTLDQLDEEWGRHT